MDACSHTKIALIPENTGRLRCRHCYLTIKAAELENGCCPECLAVSGRKRSDFEEINAEKGVVQYRCEECGARLGGTGK